MIRSIPALLPLLQGLLPVALLAACSGGGSGSGIEPASLSAQIGSAGGTLEETDPLSPLFGLRIEIPGGAFDHTTVVTARHVPVPPAHPGGRGELSVKIESGAAPKTPIAVCLPLADRDGDGVADGSGIRADFLAPVALDAASQWQFQPSFDRDPAGRIRFRIKSLTIVSSAQWPRLETRGIAVYFGSFGELSASDARLAKDSVWMALAGDGTDGPAATWRSETGCVGWTFHETTAPTQADIRVAWETFSDDPLANSNALSRTRPTLHPGSNGTVRLSFDITFNDLFLADFHLSPLHDPIAGVDLFSLAAHEFAHALGLPPECVSTQAVCTAIPMDPMAVTAPDLMFGEDRRELSTSDSALFRELHPLGFSGEAPSTAGLGPVPVVSITLDAGCNGSQVDETSIRLELRGANGLHLMLSDSDLEIQEEPGGTAVTVSHAVNAPLPEGDITALITATDLDGRESSFSWSFPVGSVPVFLESWSISAPAFYVPSFSILPGDSGSWFVEDTIGNFPDCGATPHRVEIRTAGSNRFLHVFAGTSSSTCTDNVWILNAFKAIPLVPGTRVSFVEEGELFSPSVSKFNKKIGDRIYVSFVDNRLNNVIYTPQHALGLEPFDGPTGLYAIEREVFVTPVAPGGLYVQDLYGDFMQIPGFDPKGAVITEVGFEVDEHGYATLDNLAIHVEP